MCIFLISVANACFFFAHAAYGDEMSSFVARLPAPSHCCCSVVRPNPVFQPVHPLKTELDQFYESSRLHRPSLTQPAPGKAATRARMYTGRPWMIQVMRATTNGCTNARTVKGSLTVRRRAWHTKNTAEVLQAIPAFDAGAQGITQRIASHARIAGDIVCELGFRKN